MEYKVIAHHRNKTNHFSISFDSSSCNHARFLFLKEMANRNFSVIIDRLFGEPIYLYRSENEKGTVVLDEIFLVS